MRIKTLTILVSAACFAIGCAEVVPAVATQTPLTAEQQRQAQVREEFGLPSDAAHLLAADSATGATTGELGIPLTPTEAANIRARDVLGDYAVAIESRLHSDPATRAGFAGAWIDQAAGGVLHVQTTPAADQSVTRSIASSVAAASTVVFDQVDFSADQLQQAQDALSRLIVTGQSIGSYAISVGIHPDQNRVVLLVSQDTLQTLIDATSAAHPGVSVVRTTSAYISQSRDHTSGPLYGGEWISNRFYNCTNGYSRGKHGATYVTLTAGHCGVGPWYQGSSQGGRLIGNQVSNGYSATGGSSNCDCQSIGGLPAGSTSNQVYTSDTALFTYTHTATAGNYTVGMRACVSGAAYAGSHSGGIACGQISVSSATIKYKDTGFTLTDAAETNNPGTSQGDSGGPYGNDTAFLGIHGAALVNQQTNQATGTALSKSTNFGTIGVSLYY